MLFMFTLNPDSGSNILKSGFKTSKQLESFKCISLHDLDEVDISNVQKGWINVTIFCMKDGLL